MPQLLEGGRIQYLVSLRSALMIDITIYINVSYGNVSQVADYLSEITMSLLAAAKNKNPQVNIARSFNQALIFAVFSSDLLLTLLSP